MDIKVFKEKTAVYEALAIVLSELIESCKSKMNGDISHQNIMRVFEEINLKKQLYD